MAPSQSLAVLYRRIRDSGKPGRPRVHVLWGTNPEAIEQLAQAVAPGIVTIDVAGMAPDEVARLAAANERTICKNADKAVWWSQAIVEVIAPAITRGCLIRFKGRARQCVRQLAPCVSH